MRAGYAPFFQSLEQDHTLEAAWSAARRDGSDGTAVLDLDGCLFDNRPRQVRLLRAWAESVGEVRVFGVREVHLQTWSFAESFRRAGLSSAAAEEIAEAFRPFWERWFFEDDFVGHDLPFPGAPRFVRRLREAGCRVRFLTGRTDKQRPSTLASLRRYGFGAEAEELWTKGDDDETDRAWKRRALPLIVGERPLTLFFDNEPYHLEFASERFPSAFVVWVRSDHAPRTYAGPEHLPQVHGFLTTDDLVPGALETSPPEP